MFTVKPDTGIQATSFKADDEVMIDPAKLLPLSRFTSGGGGGSFNWGVGTGTSTARSVFVSTTNGVSSKSDSLIVYPGGFARRTVREEKSL